MFIKETIIKKGSEKTRTAIASSQLLKSKKENREVFDEIVGLIFEFVHSIFHDNNPSMNYSINKNKVYE